jgi:hypothetical protein
MESFEAKLVGGGPGSAWTNLRVPAAVSKAFGKKGRVSVCGTINGFAYRSSIFPNGMGGHHMMVNKAMRDGAKAGQGERVRVTMAVDNAPREVAAPNDLAKALKGDAGARKIFQGLAPSCKKEYVEWIESAKREETRAARVEKAVAMLREGKKRD